jgi:hypothetical protein
MAATTRGNRRRASKPPARRSPTSSATPGTSIRRAPAQRRSASARTRGQRIHNNPQSIHNPIRNPQSMIPNDPVKHEDLMVVGEPRARAPRS